MRRLILALALLAGPAAAFEPMTADQCRAGWLALVGLMPAGAADRAAAGAVGLRATDDGWCRISGADPALRGANFATADWQVEGLDAVLNAGALPMALRLRFDDLRPDAAGPPSRTDFVPMPPVDVTATLRRVPETRQLLVEQVRITSPAGDDLRATAVIDRVDLGSLGMAQMSLGSMALRQVNVKVRLNGWVESQIVPGLDVEIRGDPEAIRQAARDAIAGLPPGLFTAGALRNLDAFADHLPAPRGDLEISARTETGLGLLPFVMFGVRRAGPGGAEPGADETAALLGGLSVDAIWTPDPDQTE